MTFCSDVQLEHFENMTNKKLMIFILSNALFLTFTPNGGDGLLSTGRVFPNCVIAMFWINNANPTSITINRTYQNHYYNGKIRLLKLKIRVFKKRVFYLVRHFDEGNINIFHQSKLFSMRCSLYVLVSFLVDKLTVFGTCSIFSIIQYPPISNIHRQQQLNLIKTNPHNTQEMDSPQILISRTF